MTGSPTTNKADCHWCVPRIASYDVLGEQLRYSNPVERWYFDEIAFDQLGKQVLAIIMFNLELGCIFKIQPLKTFADTLRT